MFRGTVSKTALVVALFVGNVNITQKNTNDYYEDDSDFNVVTSVLQGGWGWGINKAYASCETETDVSSQEECIEIHGYPQDEDTAFTLYGDPFEDTAFGLEQDSSYSSGGGGSTTTTQTMSDEERKARLYTQCLLDAASLYGPCVADTTELLEDLKFVCNMEASVLGWYNKVAGLIALTACFEAYKYDKRNIAGNCQADVDEAQESCS